MRHFVGIEPTLFIVYLPLSACGSVCNYIITYTKKGVLETPT